MKLIKVSAPKLALIGLACFLVAIVWTAILGRLALRTETEKLQTLTSQLPPSGGGFVVNSAWASAPVFDPALALGLAGLTLFVAASLYCLGRIIHRRFTHH
jgi:hypothetical protein